MFNQSNCALVEQELQTGVISHAVLVLQAIEFKLGKLRTKLHIYLNFFQLF